MSDASVRQRQRLQRGRKALRSLFGAGVVLSVRTASAQKVWLAVTLKKALLVIVALVAVIATMLVTHNEDRPNRVASTQGSAVAQHRDALGVRRLDPTAAAALRRSITLARTRRTETASASSTPANRAAGAARRGAHPRRRARDRAARHGVLRSRACARRIW